MRYLFYSSFEEKKNNKINKFALERDNRFEWWKENKFSFISEFHLADLHIFFLLRLKFLSHIA